MHDDDTRNSASPSEADSSRAARRRTSTEVARELVFLSAVLFLESRRVSSARGALAFASEALAVAPLHANDDAPRALLPLLAAAAAACLVAMDELQFGGAAPAVEGVWVRLGEISSEINIG